MRLASGRTLGVRGKDPKPPPLGLLAYSDQPAGRSGSSSSTSSDLGVLRLSQLQERRVGERPCVGSSRSSQALEPGWARPRSPEPVAPLSMSHAGSTSIPARNAKPYIGVNDVCDVHVRFLASRSDRTKTDSACIRAPATLDREDRVLYSVVRRGNEQLCFWLRIVRVGKRQPGVGTALASAAARCPRAVTRLGSPTPDRRSTACVATPVSEWVV